MSSNDIAISVKNLSKCYQIYDTPRDRLKQFAAPRLQRLSRRTPKQYFREFWAVKDVSFEIKKGETVGIIGRNGSGKSTLLQMICGTLNPSSGSIQTNGRIAALLELGSGFNPEFTGRENVYMNAGILGLSKEEIDARFEKIIEFADIGDFIEQPVKTYSSGMYVRLAFAVIVNVDAEILVIDEALAVGDAVFSQKCMRFLRKFKEHGTLIFVSHDTASVINLCERAIWLHSGQIRQLGESKAISEAYLHYTLQEVYGQDTELKAFNEVVTTLDEAKTVLIPSDDLTREPLINYGSDIKVNNNLNEAKGWMTGAGEILSVRLTTPRLSLMMFFKVAKKSA